MIMPRTLLGQYKLSGEIPDLPIIESVNLPASVPTLSAFPHVTGEGVLLLLKANFSTHVTDPSFLCLLWDFALERSHIYPTS